MSARHTTGGLGALGLGLVMGLCACIELEPYQCRSDDDCGLADDGRCHANDACSYADEACESGRVWSSNAPGRGGQCVEPGEDVAESGTTAASPSSTTGSAEASTSDADTSTTGTTEADTGDVASYPQRVLEDAPVAYWRLGDPFGSTVRDELGDYPGTMVGNATLEAEGLLVGDGDTAAAFVVENPQGITIDPGLDLAGGPFSAEAWLLALPEGGEWRRVVMDTDDVNGFQITITPERSLRAIVSIDGVTNSAELPAEDFAPLIDAQTPVHVVMTHDTDNLRIFVNGAMIQAYPAPGVMGANDRGVSIGGDETAWNSFFGTIDEVAVYDVALSLQQVVAHYEAGTGQDAG